MTLDREFWIMLLKVTMLLYLLMDRLALVKATPWLDMVTIKALYPSHVRNSSDQYKERITKTNSIRYLIPYISPIL